MKTISEGAEDAARDTPAARGRGVPSDRDLLERFVRNGDAAAFEALVERHGPMVLSVCQRVLGHVHEAEDAFQTTFLLLLRKAETLRRPELLGNWLYGVASRVARKARARRDRRAEREGRVPPPPAAADPATAAAWRELCVSLEQELQRLPSTFRAPLVLCYLQGLTNAEAAQRLGWPSGSISYRLARGRAILGDRLRARYPSVPSAVLVLLPAFAAVAALPQSLIDSLMSVVMALLRGLRQASAPPALPRSSTPATVSRRFGPAVIAVAAAALLAAALFAQSVRYGLFAAPPAQFPSPTGATVPADPPADGAPHCCH